jgi:SpoVK/Ycf46/Vps4 family AAA+-type ATPase
VTRSEITSLLQANTPILILETQEERRAINLLKGIALGMGIPVATWSVATGLQRLDFNLDADNEVKAPQEILAHITAATFDGIYILLDFHPFLKDPLHVRMLKELAMSFDKGSSKIVLLSHEIETPAEIRKLSAEFELDTPGDEELREIIREEAIAYTNSNQGTQVKFSEKSLDLLMRNIKGLAFNDARRLVHEAIADDGAITESDIPEVMQTKYQLLNLDGVLSCEFDASSFAELAGMKKLKKWLMQREKFFHQTVDMPGMNRPKGILLLGVQGCGKSVAAKAVAGVWSLPLLRLDVGSLYNKYYGETERNIRKALQTAEVMAPCVLWIDELEKGLAVNENDDGTSQRLLSTLLTWMAENTQAVFIVATSNNIDKLPPELIRKGRLDEVFFVDLPDAEVRESIFAIHADKRRLDQSQLDIAQLAALTQGFSGAEIEQLVVSAIYATHDRAAVITTADITREIDKTKPLSVLMDDKINALRHWAQGRTVSVD